jgi:hypothetical protein
MMADEPVQSNAKPGAYPNADRANIFGTLLLQFYQTGGDARAQAYEGLFALTYPKTKKDKDFMELYKEVQKDGGVDAAEMHRLVMEMVRVMDDIGTWDWRQDLVGEALLDGERPLETVH